MISTTEDIIYADQSLKFYFKTKRFVKDGDLDKYLLDHDVQQFEEELVKIKDQTYEFEPEKEVREPCKNLTDALIINCYNTKEEIIQTKATLNISNTRCIMQCKILHILDTISYIKLIYKFNRQITNNDIYNLFKSKFYLEGGGCSILEKTIADIIFVTGDKIKCDYIENTIEIQVFDFEKEFKYGLPIVAIQFHELRFVIDHNYELDSCIDIDPEIMGITVCNRSLRRKIITDEYHVTIINNIFCEYECINKLEDITGFASCGILLYFKNKFKDEYNDYMPIIKSISLQYNNLPEYNLRFTEIVLANITFYVVIFDPICENNQEKFQKIIYGNEKCMVIRLNRYSINIEYLSDMGSDKFDLYFHNISLNKMNICSGMIGNIFPQN